MSAEELKTVARRMYDAMNKAFSTGNLDLFSERIAAGFVEHNPMPGQGPGLEGLKQAFTPFQAAFPDLRMTVKDLVAEGDKVVARLIMRGTHKGDLMGIRPTGTQVTVEAIDILRIQGGKVVEHWGQYDQMGMMQQLGAIPPPR